MTPPTFHQCCCDPICFFGTNANDGATFCEHNTVEVLQYKKDRPAHETSFTRLDYSECDCEGSYVTAEYCPASPTVDVRYDHFQNNDISKVYTWYYQNWADVFPPCKDDCCGYGTDDDNCCDGTTLADCSSTYYLYDGSQASQFQAQVIATGTAPAESGETHADDCDYGNTYDFLRGVSNRTGAEYYRHWEYTPSGGVVEASSRVRLVESVLCLVRREKWWERYYNSLSQTDNPSASDTDNAAASCATPKWWAFGCSAQWVATWEIMLLSSLDDVGGVDVREDFIEKVHEGEAIPEAWFEVLVDDGILGPIKDYDQAGGELIKKTLSYYTHPSRGRPTTATAYFEAAPGGWTYICHDFHATPSSQMDTYFPQVARRYSISCDVGEDNNCHTAAPIPGNDCVGCITTTHGDPASVGCNPCGSMGDCDPPVTATCGDTEPEICNGDVIVGTCRGVWVNYWSYLYAKATGTYTLNYVCGDSNNGYLCRLDDIADTCEWDDLPAAVPHWIPQEVSASVRNGTSATANLCCDGKGTFLHSSIYVCPATTPRADACDDPPVWGPGL